MSLSVMCPSMWLISLKITQFLYEIPPPPPRTPQCTQHLREARVAQAVSALCLSPMKPSLVCDVLRERVPAVDLSCASGV